MSDSDNNANGPEEQVITSKQDVGAMNSVAMVLPVNAKPMELIDALLKSHQSLYQHIQEDPLLANVVKLVLISACCLLIYGVIMGAFSGELQWFVAPTKVLFGTFLSALLCFPSLYVLSALGGADLDPMQAAAFLVSSVALTGLLLVGFAPVAFVFTFSIEALPFMGIVHLLIWGISLYFGMRYAIRGLAAFGGKDAMIMKIWVFIFVLTLLQMSTTLRPILGSADYMFTTEKQFFLAHWFEALGN
ncbi:MAG: hypothetical protein AAF512_15440 [Pseudomonadota bacterium]